VILSLPVLAGLLVTGLFRLASTDADARPALLRMDGWKLSDLLAHLRSRGLDLRAHPTMKGAVIHRNAFLTRGDRPWEELEGLVKDARRVAQWKGVVYWEQAAPDAAEARVACWGDACLYAAPFVFFGDPELLMQICSALAAGRPDESLE
jgi:hypothetical protein